jgi:hypothetical protein
MDNKEILKRAKEYEKYTTELPNLRNEYNFLIDDLENKKRDAELADIMKQNATKELADKQDEFNTQKTLFERYKLEQENFISNNIKKEQSRLSDLIEEEKLQIKELNKLSEIYNKDKVEFTIYQKTELDKINKEKDIINTQKADILTENGSLSSKKKELEAYRIEVNTIKANNEKTIKLVEESEQKYLKIEKDIKKQSEMLSAKTTVIERQEKDIDSKIKELEEREDIISKKEVVLNKKEEEIKYEEAELKDKDYNLSIKEADLAAEDRRLILAFKQLKNG